MSEGIKNLGRKGFLIVFIAHIIGSFYPFAGGSAGILMYISSLIISIIGVIFLVIAFMKASEELEEPEIKKNVMRSVMCLALFFTTAAIQEIAFPDISPESFTYIAFGVFYWFITIFSALFWFKASSLLAEKVDVNFIKMGALIIIIGAVLLILLIGNLIMLLGLVIQFIGWNKIEDRPPNRGA